MQHSFDQFKSCKVFVNNGLPAFAYTNMSYRKIESKTLFSNHWVFAGFKHQLAKFGDVKPITVDDKGGFQSPYWEVSVRRFQELIVQ